MADAQIKAVITADDRASRVVAGFGSSFTRMAGAVAAGMAIFEGLRRITSGLVDIFTDSIKAFMQAENAQVRLKGAIKNVTSATDKNVDGLLDQAAALQKVTRFSDDQIISAQGILATFQLNQKAISTLTPRLIDLSEGLARVDGSMPDLENNAILVAKALGGEDVAGLSGALRRVGVIMTAYQEKVLQTGTMQERLAIITKILDQNVGGLGLTMGETASAKFIQFQNAVNDLQEQLGAALFDAVKPFLATLTEWASSDQAREVMRQLAARVVEFGTSFYNFVKNNWPEIKVALSVLWNIVKGIGFALQTVGREIRFQQQIWSNVFMIITQGAMAAQKAIDNLKKTIEGPIQKGRDFFGNLSAKIPGIGNLGQRAMGGPVTAGTPYIVGEQGPELFVPKRSGDIVANGAGSTINLSVNVGVYAGTELEKRKLAESLLMSMKDIASSKNQTLSQVMGM